MTTHRDDELREQIDALILKFEGIDATDDTLNTIMHVVREYATPSPSDEGRGTSADLDEIIDACTKALTQYKEPDSILPGNGETITDFDTIIIDRPALKAAILATYTPNAEVEKKIVEAVKLIHGRHGIDCAKCWDELTAPLTNKTEEK